MNIRGPVCLLSCSFKSTGTLIFIFAVTGTGALTTAFFSSNLSFLTEKATTPPPPPPPPPPLSAKSPLF